MESEQETFFRLLLHDDRNSYYVVSTDAKGAWTETGVKRVAIPYLQLDKRANCYITHNGFTGKRRQIERTRQLNALFFDIDAHGVSQEECIADIQVAAARIKEAVKSGVLPNPSLIVDSGRGLHLYYVLERSVPYRFRGDGSINEKGIAYFQKIQEQLADVLDEVLAGLRHMKVDRAVFDHTRVARIPGTFNTRAGRQARLLAFNETCHHLSDLIAYKPASRQSRAPERRIACIKNFNPLMTARMNKVVELQAYRKYDCEGTRELMCFVYYNSAVQVYRRDDAKQRLLSFNARFKKPLPTNEIQGIFNAVDSVVNVKGGSGHYVLKAQKVADLLGLTEQEMEATQFFASKRMTERMAAKKKTKEKRESRNQRIVTLYEQGSMTQQEVALSVGCSLRTVKNVLKEAGLTRPRMAAAKAPAKRQEAPRLLSWLSAQAEGAFSCEEKRAKKWLPCLGVRKQWEDFCFVEAAVSFVPGMQDACRQEKTSEEEPLVAILRRFKTFKSVLPFCFGVPLPYWSKAGS